MFTANCSFRHGLALLKIPSPIYHYVGYLFTAGKNGALQLAKLDGVLELVEDKT